MYKQVQRTSASKSNMQNKLRKTTTSLRRLLSRARKSKSTLQHSAGCTCDSHQCLEQRIDTPLREADRYSSFFSYRRDGAENKDAENIRHSHGSLVRSLTDKLLHDDAIELDTNDLNLITDMAEERRASFSRANARASDTTSSGLPENGPSTEYSTALYRYRASICVAAHTFASE